MLLTPRLPLLILTISLALAGCTKAPATARHEHDHEHAKPGPHGGHLIELGEEAYHGELAHDDPTHKVTVYLLDGAAEKTPPAGELPKSVTLRFTMEGKDKPVDYVLNESSTGRYDLTDEVLCAVLDGETELKLELLATIAGKEYRGTLEHHAHEGHHHHHHGSAEK